MYKPVDNSLRVAFLHERGY